MPRDAVRFVTMSVSTKRVRSALSIQTAICGPRSSRVTAVDAARAAGGVEAVGLEAVVRASCSSGRRRGPGRIAADSPTREATEDADAGAEQGAPPAIFGRAAPPRKPAPVASGRRMRCFAHANRHRRRRHEDRRARARRRRAGAGASPGRAPRRSTTTCCAAIADVVARLERETRRRAPRDGRGLHAGLPAAGQRPHPQRQPALPQRSRRSIAISRGAIGRPVRLANDAKCFVLSRGGRRRGGRRRRTSTARAPTSCSARRWGPAWAAASSSTAGC